MSNFTKDESLKLKGVAILIMMWHHCFLPGRYEMFDISFFPFTENFVMSLAKTGKICVSIYVFITGYGLTLAYNKNRKKESLTKWYVKRLISLLSGYWFIVVLCWSICQGIDGYTYRTYFSEGILYGIVKAIVDFFGLSHLFQTSTLMGTWWYMSAAIGFVFLVPILNEWIEKRGCFVLILASVFLGRMYGINFLGGNQISTYLLILIAGIMFAREDLFKITTKKHALPANIAIFLFATITFVLSFVLWLKVPVTKIWEIQFALVPLVVILYCKKYILNLPLVGNLLLVFGKHSMNIFLVHSFIRYQYANKFIYSQGNFIKIMACLFLISLAISFAIEGLKKLLRYDEDIRRLTNICVGFCKDS